MTGAEAAIEAAREQRVRERAYAVWEREGRPGDGAERHWAVAEVELRAQGPERPAGPASDGGAELPAGPIEAAAAPP